MVKKGFTLIELIIVIGIIALLATTVILVINPAKIFQEARDSQRIADMGQVRSAMGLYLATAASISMAPGVTCTNTCWTLTIAGLAANCGGRHPGKTSSSTALQLVDGTGWVPVNLTQVSSGSPISAYPRDPRNTTTLFYSYACDRVNNAFELDAKMESTRYSAGGTDDVEGTDGGNSGTLFEIGNDPGLDL